MQKWPLERKVFHAIEVMESFCERIGGTDKAYVSFSGGVDSTVLLHMARRFVDPDMKAVFFNTGMEWPEIVRFVKTFDNVEIVSPKRKIPEIFEMYGFPLVSKRVSQYVEDVARMRRRGNTECVTYKKRMCEHPDRVGCFDVLPKKWRYLLDKPYQTSWKCCHYLKKEPAYRYEKETGIHPITGVMASESIRREVDYVRNGGCNTFGGVGGRRMMSRPLSIWTSDDVWEYIRRGNLQYCSIYDDMPEGINKRTGCVACGYGANVVSSKFALLYRRMPKYYQYVMNLTNNGVTFRQALKDTGAELPDEETEGER